jgi:hypothetical protein
VSGWEQCRWLKDRQYLAPKSHLWSLFPHLRSSKIITRLEDQKSPYWVLTERGGKINKFFFAELATFEASGGGQEIEGIKDCAQVWHIPSPESEGP